MLCTRCLYAGVRAPQVLPWRRPSLQRPGQVTCRGKEPFMPLRSCHCAVSSRPTAVASSQKGRPPSRRRLQGSVGAACISVAHSRFQGQASLNCSSPRRSFPSAALNKLRSSSRDQPYVSVLVLHSVWVFLRPCLPPTSLAAGRRHSNFPSAPVPERAYSAQD
ncbi:hypothetical protein BC628DRAFT_943484 [Trametes gibbosa]|nr:hypothetical protein BC628DRAFT_943484 [Trametes gibbosa]